MKQKVSQLNAPALAGVINQSTMAGVISEIKNYIFDGASMFDLHMEWITHLDDTQLATIMNCTNLPILALNYCSTPADADLEALEQARVESLLRAVKAGAAGIDMQGYTFHHPSKSGFYGEDKYSFTKGNPKEVITDEKIIARQCDLIEQIHAMDREVLLSCHPGIPMTSDQVVELALFLEQRNPDIIKIVTVAENEDDLHESIRAMMALKKEVKTPVTYHANGAAGTLSRIVNPILGGHIAFCVDRYDNQSFVEQPQLKAVREIIDNIQRNI